MCACPLRPDPSIHFSTSTHRMILRAPKQCWGWTTLLRCPLPEALRASTLPQGGSRKRANVGFEKRREVFMRAHGGVFLGAALLSFVAVSVAQSADGQGARDSKPVKITHFLRDRTD